MSAESFSPCKRRPQMPCRLQKCHNQPELAVNDGAVASCACSCSLNCLVFSHNHSTDRHANATFLYKPEIHMTFRLPEIDLLSRLEANSRILALRVVIVDFPIPNFSHSSE